VDTFECCSREAAENHFARAKDLAGMVEAVSEKLRGQAEYVEWWDRQPKAQGRRYSHRASETAARVGQDGIPAKNVLQPRGGKQTKLRVGQDGRPHKNQLRQCNGLNVGIA
jgi:hypothetical protein